MDVSQNGTSTAVAAEQGRLCQFGASIVTVKVGTIMIAAGPAALAILRGLLGKGCLAQSRCP